MHYKHHMLQVLSPSSRTALVHSGTNHLKVDCLGYTFFYSAALKKDTTYSYCEVKLADKAPGICLYRRLYNNIIATY